MKQSVSLVIALLIEILSKLVLATYFDDDHDIWRLSSLSRGPRYSIPFMKISFCCFVALFLICKLLAWLLRERNLVLFTFFFGFRQVINKQSRALCWNISILWNTSTSLTFLCQTNRYQIALLCNLKYSIRFLKTLWKGCINII